MNASQQYKEAQASINTIARTILGGFNSGYFEIDNSELQNMLHELQAAFNQEEEAIKALTCWAMPRSKAT